MAFDAFSGFVYGEAAELVGFRPSHSGLGAGVMSLALWVRHAHPDSVAVHSFGFVLLDEQYHFFLFVPFPHLFSAGMCCLDYLGGVEAQGPPIMLHGLRHGAASMALAAGTDVKVASAELGHSTTYFTQDTYQTVFPGVAKSAAEATAALIRGTAAPAEAAHLAPVR